jgi:hypothetical protein
MEILTKRPVINAKDYNNVEFNSYEDTPMENLTSNFDDMEFMVDEEMSNAFGDKLKGALKNFKAGKGGRQAKRADRKAARKTKRTERQQKRALLRKEKGNIFERFKTKWREKFKKEKGVASVTANDIPKAVATAAPLQISAQSTPTETKFNRPLPEQVPSSVLGTATTPPAPKNKAELATAFRAWANSTPALKLKYGKDSPYDLDAVGGPNSYFDIAFAAGQAEFKAATATSGLNLTKAEVVTLEPTGTIKASDPAKPTIPVGTQLVATENIPEGKVPVVDENGNASTLHNESEVTLATDPNGIEQVFLTTETQSGKVFDLKQWSTLKKVIIFGVVPLVVIGSVIVAVKMNKSSKSTSPSSSPKTKK